MVQSPQSESVSSPAKNFVHPSEIVAISPSQRSETVQNPSSDSENVKSPWSYLFNDPALIFDKPLAPPNPAALANMRKVIEESRASWKNSRGSGGGRADIAPDDGKNFRFPDSVPIFVLAPVPFNVKVLPDVDPALVKSVHRYVNYVADSFDG